MIASLDTNFYVSSFDFKCVRKTLKWNLLTNLFHIKMIWRCIRLRMIETFPCSILVVPCSSYMSSDLYNIQGGLWTHVGTTFVSSTPRAAVGEVVFAPPAHLCLARRLQPFQECNDAAPPPLLLFAAASINYVRNNSFLPTLEVIYL